jgi:ASCH domain-containing protein
MKGLISKSPHVENILKGQKTWEIRGCNTKNRGEIALIKSGSGTIVGKCEIIDVIGPIDISTLQKNVDKHCVPLERIEQVLGRYKKAYAWVLSNAYALNKPVSYEHPQGAIIWVNLDSLVI